MSRLLSELVKWIVHREELVKWIVLRELNDIHIISNLYGFDMFRSKTEPNYNKVLPFRCERTVKNISL